MQFDIKCIYLKTNQIKVENILFLFPPAILLRCADMSLCDFLKATSSLGFWPCKLFECRFRGCSGCGGGCTCTCTCCCAFVSSALLSESFPPDSPEPAPRVNCDWVNLVASSCHERRFWKEIYAAQINKIFKKRVTYSARNFVDDIRSCFANSSN